MKKGKRFAWNALCATGAWILYNTFFLFIHILYDFSTIEWDFGFEPMPFFMTRSRLSYCSCCIAYPSWAFSFWAKPC